MLRIKEFGNKVYMEISKENDIEIVEFTEEDHQSLTMELLSKGRVKKNKVDSKAVSYTHLNTVGVLSVTDKQDGSRKRLSPMFILPQFQGRGYAQEAIRQAEKIHGERGWELDTILQEERLVHLYEKMGYRKTGKTAAVNPRMTLVFYQKL